MKYKVISSFVERDENGEATGRRPMPGEEVELSSGEATRLIKAQCIEATETSSGSVVEIMQGRGKRFGRRRA